MKKSNLADENSHQHALNLTKGLNTLLLLLLIFIIFRFTGSLVLNHIKVHRICYTY